ncbi:hypothetical protein OG819_10645 [Streptomyces sp. NBC_01549]|uniref:hypothetical protein n=1 Tax=Streptomyces sp. NBC_01549 TaxID=2975874 RepID=UPI00225AB216|nr:hypothetical protein [Streptomyces sp. NBC_01549]MCX4590203.1 hypothetical protein [Streptomyces sp. NBC_01549]
MPRGRHRHSPPLHRLLPPSAIAGVSLVCAVGPWLFTEPTVLRALAAAAAVTAVAGGVVMRRWDTAAGKRVADLTRARASDEWRHEERVAELETDLDESRELRTKLEHKLRAKRAELAGLRNEHAALLRRYATAETERASALEGRRLLEIETVAPARALTAGAETVESAESVDAVDSAEPEAPEGVAAEDEDLNEGAGDGAGEDTDDGGTAEDVTAAEAENAAEEPTDAPASAQVFSPAGSSLFLRASTALSRITNGEAATEVSLADTESDTDPDTDTDADPDTDPDDDAKPGAEAEVDVDSQAGSEAEVETEAASDSAAESGADADAAASGSDEGEHAKGESAKGGSVKGEPPTDGPPKGSRPLTDAKPAALPVPAARAVSVEAEPPAQAPHPVKPSKPARASGHFTVPTAVAVAPAAPVRRPSVEGGFDFFGTQKGTSSAAMEVMQNEDLADVVGQEALALHKAEAESGFKPVDEGSRGVGQVIDLTAHDETEQIDLAELRTAAS